MTAAANSFALIADIHGNSWALDAVLADLERRGVVSIINLGDSLDGPLDPAGTAARLLALGPRLAFSLRGDGERLLLDDLATDAAHPLYRQLDAAALAWLQALPNTAWNGELLCCHGTPVSDETYQMEEVLPDGTVRPLDEAALADELAGLPSPIVACAHSHLPRAVRLPGGRLAVNPGSVGLPALASSLPYPHVIETGGPQARYAVITRTADGWEAELVAVDYPWQEAADAARRNGRDDWAGWLATGRATPPPPAA